MDREFYHLPIMLDEVLEGLAIKPGGTYVDGTIGGAGHSQEILKRLEGGRLIGIDQDQEALAAARMRLEKIGSNFDLVHGNFSDLDQALDGLGIDKVDGVLLDIGVSSFQFDRADRGFSYRFEGPLDMRMDQGQSLTARDIVNSYSMEDLEEIIFNYGEERWARRIAEFIVWVRKDQPLETTQDLVTTIKRAIPKGARREGGHPAKRTFQALRIAVNSELDVLEASIPMMVDRLRSGGRLAIISFHSLEDRIVKKSFQYLHKTCICPPEIPVCVCDKKREIEIITKKPTRPRQEELEANPRSRSAKLRIAEKI